VCIISTRLNQYAVDVYNYVIREGCGSKSYIICVSVYILKLLSSSFVYDFYFFPKKRPHAMTRYTRLLLYSIGTKPLKFYGGGANINVFWGEGGFDPTQQKTVYFYGGLCPFISLRFAPMLYSRAVNYFSLFIVNTAYYIGWLFHRIRPHIQSHHIIVVLIKR